MPAQRNINIQNCDCPKLVKDFLTYISAIRGKSPRTVQAYYGDLAFFFRYIKVQMYNLTSDSPTFSDIICSDLSDETVLSLTVADVYGFLNHVQSEKNNNSRTVARKMSSIRSFYKYLSAKTGRLENDPMKTLETPTIKKSLPKYLTLEESRQLLSVIDGPQKERDYCMIALMLNCGMRVSELAGIRISAIKENTLVLLGKGNKERMVYLNRACLDAIGAYMLVRKEPRASAKDILFIGKNGTGLTTRRIEQIVEDNLAKANLSGRGFSPHKLRHTAATLMYQYGNVDIRVLQDILGHENLGTTEIYTHIADQQKENAANASPLSDFSPSPNSESEKQKK